MVQPVTARIQKPLDAPPSNPAPRIGVLIVSYNAETTIESVLARIPAEVWAMVEEIAVFDDASGDNTQAKAIQYKESSGHQNLTIIKNKQNLGYGGNQKHGYRYFMEKQFDIVVMLHGDGQYAPEMLPQLYTPILSGRADAVFGSRMMGGYGGPLRGGMPLYKFIGNRILTALENKLLGMQLSEFHSGYRAYSLAMLRQIDLTYMTDDFHFDTQIIIKIHHQKFAIEEIPIPTHYGDEISHVNGLKYARDIITSLLRYHQTIRAAARHAEFGEYFSA